MISVTDLKPGYSIFGNKGAVWANEAHIAKNDFSGLTLCGTPMLSSNHARIQKLTHVGCPKCIAVYTKEQGT